MAFLINFIFSVMSKITKSAEQLIAEKFGYCTLAMLNGDCVSVTDDPLEQMCLGSDGQLHSDTRLIQQMEADASVQALINSRFQPRTVSSVDGVVGSRHTSLAQALARAQAADLALSEGLIDSQSKLDASVSSSVEPSNNVE